MVHGARQVKRPTMITSAKLASPRLFPTILSVTLAFLSVSASGCAVEEADDAQEEGEDGTDDPDGIIDPDEGEDGEETGTAVDAVTGSCTAWAVQRRANQKACIEKIDANTVRASASVKMKERPANCSVRVQVMRRTFFGQTIASRTYACPANGSTKTWRFNVDVTRAGKYSSRVKVINATPHWTDSPKVTMNP